MFRVGKLEDVENTIVDYYINDLGYVDFNISGDNYSLSFEMNIKKEDILNIKNGELFSMNDYLTENEMYFNTLDDTDTTPDINITGLKLDNNTISIYVIFLSEMVNSNEHYSGEVEFNFELK